MMACLSPGVPSVEEYLTSPWFSTAAAPAMAASGVLFLGSPMPRWITASPFARRMRASSFSLRVGDSAMDEASWLRPIGR